MTRLEHVGQYADRSAGGFAYGLLDVLNKHFQNTLGITKLQSTGLQVAYFGVGYFAFSPIAGEVLRRRGYKFTIIMGLTCEFSVKSPLMHVSHSISPSLLGWCNPVLALCQVCWREQQDGCLWWFRYVSAPFGGNQSGSPTNLQLYALLSLRAVWHLSKQLPIVTSPVFPELSRLALPSVFSSPSRSTVSHRLRVHSSLPSTSSPAKMRATSPMCNGSTLPSH